MQIFRSRFGQVITWIVGLIMTLTIASGIAESGFWSVVSAIAPASLAVFLVWVLFYKPRVEVSESEIRLVNVFRTIEIPLEIVSRIDTRWALTLFVGEKKYTAWGATAPGRHTAFFATKDQGSHLPESSYLAGTVRPGDLVNTESGAAAAYIRRLWEDQRGLTDSERKAIISFHSGSLMTLAVLTGMTIASL